MSSDKYPESIVFLLLITIWWLRNTHGRRQATTPAWSVELARLWSGRGQRMGIAGERGAGTLARGLPDRAAASYGVMEVC